MLRIEHLNKTFNIGTPIENHALCDISLSLAPGDYVTLVGGNGAGKSTLLNAVAGSFLPDTGTISIDGTDVTKLYDHKRAPFLGRVFQDPLMGTASDMSIEENLALAYRRGQRRTLRWYITQGERKLYRDKLATLELGLENRLSDKVGQLSGGQRQALTLLMATIKQPKLLLLDEHTAALDPKTAPKVLEIGDKLIGEYGLTTIMVTHNMFDAITHGNRLIMMSGGQIILDVSGQEKAGLTVEDLIAKFSEVSGKKFQELVS
ncbi:MAG: ATP-binding cassette domain-containing protein [Defluviitaleaceae bacterium]|nr:ATP-binding cassette domain-containing protein [Defluviitaleaceae bacterium]